jgi:hypothetical protein
MRRVTALLLAINFVLMLIVGSPALALSPFPIKDKATTIVGTGENIGTQPLPERPSKQEFFRLFDVYNCSSTSQTNFNCPEANESRKNFVYERLSDPLRSDRFKKLLTSRGKIKIYLRPPISSGFVGGAKYGGNIIQYWGYVENADGAVGKWSMIHEAAHIIELRSPGVYASLPLNELAGSETDNDCYERRSDGDLYFITYNNVGVSASSGKSETFGDIVGANVMCGPNDSCSKGGGGDGLGKTIRNYPEKCPKTYRWIRDNIYGGVDYHGLGTGGSTDTGGFVFYCQGDPDWNRSGSICGANGLTQRGCLPTTIAMVFSSLGKVRTPPQVIQSLKDDPRIRDNRIGCTTPGYVTDFIEAGWFEREGFAVSYNLVDYNGGRGRLNLREAKRALESGSKKYIIAGADGYPCSEYTRCANPRDKISHAFVITGVNPNPDNPYEGTVEIRDPMGCTFSGKETAYTRTRRADFVSNWQSAYAIKAK